MKRKSLSTLHSSLNRPKGDFKLKIGLAQIEVLAGQPDLNAAKILKFIEMAKAQNCDAVIFPAAAISGVYFNETPAFVRECENFINEVVAATSQITVIFGNGRDIIIAYDKKITRRVKDGISSAFVGTLENEQLGFMLEPSTFAHGRITRRENFCAKQAQNAKCPLFYLNSIGIQNTGKTIYTFDGCSTVYNSKGEVVKRLKPFEEVFDTVSTAKIEQLPALEPYNEKPIAQVYNALNFGVDRFLKQIHMSKIVIGISGGIDSAVAAALYTKVLGAENVYLVNMPSVFNSETTRHLSEQLAKNLGCKYCVVTIQNSVDSTVHQLEMTPVTFLRDNTTEDIKISSFVRENLQARDRSGRVLATLAATIGGGFTCNANKAETTIGYATLYGDCAGVLAATADLWKFQVYDLAKYMNEKIYSREVIPQGIIDIVPSAELSDAQNVDEGKGDPLHYDYHDYLLRAFVEKLLTPEDILQAYLEKNLESVTGCAAGLTEKYFETAEDFIADLEKWWRQYQGIAVAKRIQAPPLIAVSSRPFGSFAESQNAPYFTKKYFELKNTLTV